MTLTKNMSNTNINMSTETRAQMIDILNQHLADSLDLYSQVKQAHWNVKGMYFISLHELFDEVAEPITEIIDDLAERATALGGEAKGTVRMAAANSTLPEFPTDIDTGEAFVHAVVERVAVFTNNSRANADRAMDAGDEATADLFIEITRETDKLLYFLESHIR